MKNRDEKGRFTSAKSVVSIITDTEYRYGPATITLKRAGQVDRRQNDQVQVTATLFLPSLPSRKEWYHYINEECRFGDRVCLFEQPLFNYWGEHNGKASSQSQRFRTKKFCADRWHRAFSNAKRYAETEVDKLISAIKTREQALLDAEKLD